MGLRYWEDSRFWRAAFRGLVLLGAGAGETDGVGDVVEFLAGDVFELFAFGREFLVNFDDLFGHDFMGFLGAAHEREIRAGSDALVAVVVEPQTEHDRFLLLFGRGVRHCVPKVRVGRVVVN